MSIEWEDFQMEFAELYLWSETRSGDQVTELMETRSLWTQLSFHSLKQINHINYVVIYSTLSLVSFDDTERGSEYAYHSPNT